MVHGCDPQKYREFLCWVPQTFGPICVGRWGDRQHTVLCTCTQMLTRPHGVTIQKVCLLAGRTELEAQFTVRSGHQEWWMPVIILYSTDCHNYLIYPAVGWRIVGRGDLIASANTIQRPSCHMFTILLPVSMCLPVCDKQHHVQFTVIITHSYSDGAGKAVPVCTMKAYRGGVEVQGGSTWRRVLNFTPQALYPKRKSLQLQLNWRQGGP